MRQRRRVEIHGAVQGVGFRPFVYRLARELGLSGWVSNDTRGVFIEAEGDDESLDCFVARLTSDKPPRALIHSLTTAPLAPQGETDFEIRPSDSHGAKTALVLPDVATCPDCLAEVLDPANRRYRYPFTNCTNCGPRFTILRDLPYDRPNTTMRGFRMCPLCQAEYDDPLDRRFHAQPNACPACGPSLSLLRMGEIDAIARGDDALCQAAQALRDGQVVALKGLGGFQLLVDARDKHAVARLRIAKTRPDKPLAVMVRDLDMARDLCDLTEAEAALLQSPEAPIVLLPRRADAPVAANVAPDNPTRGVMLPYTPLHHLLLRDLGFPLVATSGNLSDEPICIDEAEALARLGHIADLFLVHDRPIERHADDSVTRVVLDAPQVQRRARGYAPLPVLLPDDGPTVLAVGAHQKNTVALAVGRQAFVSQHIGDLATSEALGAFERVSADFVRLYDARPAVVAHDLHPDYPSSHWARDFAARQGIDLVAVQHHHAHLAACLADNGVAGRALGVTWDGTGYGTDGTVWGGEFLLGDAAGYERVASLRPFRLPGGEAAVREPRRVALALLWAMEGSAALDRDDLASIRAFRPSERRLLGQMLTAGVNSPVTTSAGRLFDGLAALLGLSQRVTFEGQAAMALEFAAGAGDHGVYPFGWAGAGEGKDAPFLVLDWQPLVEAVLVDVKHGMDREAIAARIHSTFVAMILAVARRVGEPRVALSGGCFQNRRLTEHTARRLQAAGFEALLHRQVPPNDGGISLGQVAVARAQGVGG